MCKSCKQTKGEDDVHSNRTKHRYFQRRYRYRILAGRPGITKLAMYEAPFVVDDTGKPVTPAFLASVKEAVAQNQRSKAVKLFMKQVGVPSFMLAIMPLFPMWSKLTAVAHTLPYDISTIVAYGAGVPLPKTLGEQITAAILVMNGGKSPTGMRHSMQALAQTLPNANYRTLP